MDKKKGHPEVSGSQARARQRASGGVSVYLPQPPPPSTLESTNQPDWLADWTPPSLIYGSRINGYQSLQPLGSSILFHSLAHRAGTPEP